MGSSAWALRVNASSGRGADLGSDVQGFGESHNGRHGFEESHNVHCCGAVVQTMSPQVERLCKMRCCMLGTVPTGAAQVRTHPHSPTQACTDRRRPTHEASRLDTKDRAT